MSEEIEAHVLDRYEILSKLGRGAYGVVWKARNRLNGKMVALKKVFDAFQNSTDAQRTYREVMYLQHLNGHENIVRLLSILRAHNNKDLYLVFDLMETDLHLVIRAKILKPIHKQFIMYQLFKALKYIHSADLIHRDLKPSNMLINSDCSMKLADFGLARSVALSHEGMPVVSDYIATRWYRAPEILLGSQQYSKAVDMWSAGCIMAEILMEKVLFAGKSSLNQIELIIELLGRPSEKDIRDLNVGSSSTLLNSIKNEKSLSFSETFAQVGSDALGLLRKLLVYSPQNRLTVEEVLEHPYFAAFHSPEEEIVCEMKITIPINDNEKLSLKAYREAIYENISEKVKEQNRHMNDKNLAAKPLDRNPQPSSSSPVLSAARISRHTISEKPDPQLFGRKKGSQELLVREANALKPYSKLSKKVINNENLMPRKNSREQAKLMLSESKSNIMLGKKISLCSLKSSSNAGLIESTMESKDNRNSISHKRADSGGLRIGKPSKSLNDSRNLSLVTKVKRKTETPAMIVSQAQKAQIVFRGNQPTTSGMKVNPYFLFKSKIK